MDLSESERLKYERMWSFDAYREFSPAEAFLDEFMKVATPPRGATINDYGCGSGRADVIMGIRGLRVTAIDFASNCLDDDVRQIFEIQKPLKFVEANLWDKPVWPHASLGYCCDVMEHIPEEKIDDVLKNITSTSARTFFSIGLTKDNCGKLTGEKLHMTVKPFSWWEAKLSEHGAVLLKSNLNDATGLFFVSGWAPAAEVMKDGKLNVASKEIADNVKHSLSVALRTVSPHRITEDPIMIVGGGPSLEEFRDEIIEKRRNGVKLVTVNGSYNWVIENGVWPSAQIVVDARPFNARFVKPFAQGCHYLLASQCHPDVFKALGEAGIKQTWLWHANFNEDVKKILDDFHGPTGWYPVVGGSTVMLRAISLMRMLGRPNMELYGFDSCIISDRHHAYSQPENDDEPIVRVSVGGRVFECHPWMVSQAREFIDTIKMLGDDIQLEVHGDGLIKHILRTGAEDFDAI